MDNPDFKLVFRDYYQGLYLQRIVKEDLATATADITKQSAVDRIKSIGLLSILFLIVTLETFFTYVVELVVFGLCLKIFLSL